MNNNYWSLDCDVIQGPKDAGIHFARAATPAIAIRICELLNIEDRPVQALQKRITRLESALSDIASGAACLGGYGIADASAAARDALSANVKDQPPEGLPASACSPSSDSFDGVEPHLAGGSIGGASGDVGNPDSYLGIVGYDYCPLSEVIRAAESKGVRLLKSDLINNESESVNQGVVLFRGIRAQLVDAIYDGSIGGAAIEKILQTLRCGNLAHDGILRNGQIIEGSVNTGEVRHHGLNILENDQTEGPAA